MSDEPNDFGISGLMGNVREWCQDTPEGATSAIERLVVGATGFLGEDTFDFDYKTPLYPRNTNPDVGFRIARSLSADDCDALDARQNELKQLPPAAPDEPIGLSGGTFSKGE
jgi:formylglycine-generating enzyme required for sulfatase activity